ncbi:hypothetical protein [Dysgonomonas sp. 216]|uniref:hypothetical protein n=1 Tax=Dysgonomonas sp. 216 TaxID=2302934 RepID=UPI0013D48CED|nr:hypothetical protein [Dysgonomonas sp. 216]
MKVDIMQNMGYSIGTVQLILTPSTNQRSAGDASIYFSLDINDLIYKKQKDKGLSNNKYKKMKIGERYMVVYDTTNIENCILLVDYPVRDSIDYFRYMEEFKNQPFDLNGEFQTPLYRLLFSND